MFPLIDSFAKLTILPPVKSLLTLLMDKHFMDNVLIFSLYFMTGFFTPNNYFVFNLYNHFICDIFYTQYHEMFN